MKWNCLFNHLYLVFDLFYGISLFVIILVIKKQRLLRFKTILLFSILKCGTNIARGHFDMDLVFEKKFKSMT